MTMPPADFTSVLARLARSTVAQDGTLDDVLRAIVEARGLLSGRSITLPSDSPQPEEFASGARPFRRCRSVILFLAIV